MTTNLNKTIKKYITLNISLGLSLVFLIDPTFAGSKKSSGHDMFDVADAYKGKQLASLCLTCHNVKKGEPSKGVSLKRVFVGPNLFGIAGKNIASVADYKYSKALKRHSKKKWDLKNLDLFLRSPAHFAPRNRMEFTGILDPQDRMDVIAYLMTLK